MALEGQQELEAFAPLPPVDAVYDAFASEKMSSVSYTHLTLPTKA